MEIATTDAGAVLCFGDGRKVPLSPGEWEELRSMVKPPEATAAELKALDDLAP